MIDRLTSDSLKEKQRSLRDGFPDLVSLRVHRALSWLIRAEKETDDLDVRFILLWIGFNAAYALDLNLQTNKERELFKAFFDTLDRLDARRRIYNAVWGQFSREIGILLTSKYVFASYWHHQNGLEGHADWQVRLDASWRKTQDARTRGDASTILSTVFDRLYVLRNQLVHGGATWNSSLNRDQVRDGAAILVPAITIG